MSHYLKFLPLLLLIYYSISLKAEKYDFGNMFNFTISKQVTPRFGAHIQQNIWTNSNFGKYERYMPIVAIDYAVWKSHLKLNALYYYMNQRTADGSYKNRNRYQLGFTALQSAKRIDISWASRFESTYTRGVSEPNNKWRNRIKLSYIISKDSSWKPFLYADLFLLCNGTKQGKLERVWYDAGVEYRIDKHNSAEIKIREEQLITTSPRQLNTMISFSYKIKL